MNRPPVRSLLALASALASQWWPQVVALAAACAVVATTVAGAVGVGDALSRGLLDLAVSRLGRIDAAVTGPGFFRRALADELAAAAGADDSTGARCVPAIVMPVSVAGADGSPAATLLACDDPAALGFAPPPPPLAEGAVLVNAALARAAGVKVGDALVVRLPRRSSVPADSPLGRRDAESVGRRMTIAAVLTDAGLGRFSLRPTQVTEPLVVMALVDAQAILREGDVANVIFAAASEPGSDPAAWLARHLRPRLADHGLAFEAVATGVHRLTSRRLVLPPAVDRAAAEVLAPRGGQPSLAFLANDIVPRAKDGGTTAARVPYSTVLGVATAQMPGGGLVDDDGRPLVVPADDEVIVDRWLADDLAAQGRLVGVGDELAVTFFLPETLHGQVTEATTRLRIAGIAAMRGAAVDRSLVPEVEGVTDEASIADWDPPFPFDAARVRTVPPHDEDDRFWKEYRATPKAFVSLATARRVAAGRFGATTAWHVPVADAAEADDLALRLAAAIDPVAAGFAVVPLRADALAAARGSTPFGGLFLALSSFVVVAGLVLVWLLFGLLVAAHRRTVGLLAAVGWPPSRVAMLLLAVGAVAAGAGTVIGAVAGPLWARGLVASLATAWDRDVAEGSAVAFAAARPSWWATWPAAGAALLVSLAALGVAALRASRLAPRPLLAGASTDPSRVRPRGPWARRCAALLLAGAVAAAIAGRRADAAAAVGMFFVAGFAALAGLLALVRDRLTGAPARGAIRSLAALAGRLQAATPGRAFSVAGIVACGQFLVVAVSAFALRPPADPDDPHSPTGGWAWIASFNEATSVDPADAVARGALGLSVAQDEALAACTIARLRSSDGDDASCTNLYAAGRSTVCGVGTAFIERGGFRFVAHAASAGTDAAANPWGLLAAGAPRPAGHPIPAILDQATAQWGLKLGGVGSRFRVPDETGTEIECEIVGLLDACILQGRVIVAERDFERLFPSQSGYRMALIDASRVPAATRATVAAAARAAWADAGVTLEPAVERLRSLQAVQNTFLAGFQALGTLGLLLGTAGVAAVQLQSVVERLGALSVLRAIGFTIGRIRRLLVLETLGTIGLGLAAGTAAGIVAVWPALVGGTARVPLVWIAATAGLTLAAAALAGWIAATRATIPERPR
jgi:putative ABC transport system permease protein